MKYAEVKIELYPTDQRIGRMALNRQITEPQWNAILRTVNGTDDALISALRIAFVALGNAGGNQASSELLDAWLVARAALKAVGAL